MYRVEEKPSVGIWPRTPISLWYLRVSQMLTVAHSERDCSARRDGSGDLARSHAVRRGGSGNDKDCGREYRCHQRGAHPTKISSCCGDGTHTAS